MDRRHRYTSLADKAAKLYAPGVHILSALAFVGWFIYSWDVRTALNIAAAVLIITCPCALGLAVPAVTTAASGRLFRKGMLVKHETALERLAKVNTVVFDQTGPLTPGPPTTTNTPAHPTPALPLAPATAQGTSPPPPVPPHFGGFISPTPPAQSGGGTPTQASDALYQSGW